MLGGLAAKWRWRKRREADGVDARGRISSTAVTSTWSGTSSPLLRHRAEDDPDEAVGEVHDRPRGGRASSTRTRSASSASSVRRSRARRTTSPQDRRASRPPARGERARRAAARRRRQRRLRPAVPASGHQVGLPPRVGAFDQRLRPVRPQARPGIGWLIFREPDDLPEDLVFMENYLGKTDATFTLNFSTGSAMVLAQYYNFCRFGREGYGEIIRAMGAETRTSSATRSRRPSASSRWGGRMPAARLLPPRRPRSRLRRVRRRLPVLRAARLDGLGLHLAGGCERGDRDEGAREGERGPRRREAADRRSRRGARDARQEGRHASER